VSGASQRFVVHTTAPAGAAISVKPSAFLLPAGQTKKLTITIDGEALAAAKQYFGSITLDAASAANDVYIPLAFFKQQGPVTLTHTCSPTSFPVGSNSSCTVRAQNLTPSDAATHIDVTSPDPSGLGISNAAETHNETSSGVLTPSPDRGFTWDGTLSASIAPTVDSITPEGPGGGYLPLSSFGVAPQPGMGDETIANFGTPPFQWGRETYSRIGATSNGYVVVGGGTASDVVFIPQTMPNPARPNNVIAPWWTDIDLSQAATANTGLRVAILTDGADEWLVLDYEDVATYGTCSPTPASCDKHDFQIWIGLSGDAHPGEDVTMSFGDLGVGSVDGLKAGAENRSGTSGVNMTPLPADGTDWRINTSPPTPGGFVQITYDARGKRAGTYVIPARMTTDQTAGTTTQRVTLTVT
jgi:hypothetical protein